MFYAQIPHTIHGFNTFRLYHVRKMQQRNPSPRFLFAIADHVSRQSEKIT